MLKALCHKIWGEFSLTRVHEEAQALYATDRWDTFDKFAETSLSLHAMMGEAGLHCVQRLPHATGGPVGDGSWRVKHTWQVNRATLTILEPSVDPHLKVLADYHAEPLSLVMFSDSTPAGGVEADVVLYPGESLWPDRTAPAQSESDLAGKLVLTHQGIREKWVDVVEKGALGLITDIGSERRHRKSDAAPAEASLPHEYSQGVAWQKFGWAGWPPLSTKRCFGFSLSPERGTFLRRLLAQGRVVAKADVDTSLAPGRYYTVTATIPGADWAEQEIWVVAHPYEPGMCDNSIGCAVAIEAVRTLNSLVDAGVLPAPRRTIRLVVMHETYGLLAHLEAVREAESLGDIIAALNLDSPSAASAEGKPMPIHTDPASLPSFGPWLCTKAYDAAAATGPAEVTSWGWTLAPWSQCDQIMDDPMIGATTPWPLADNAHHHTSLDGPGTSSDHLTRLVGVTAAAYLYALATAGADEATSWARELASDIRHHRPASHPFYAEYERTRLLSFARLAGGEESLLSNRLDRICNEVFGVCSPSVRQDASADGATARERLQAKSMVPIRKHLFVWDHENVFRDDLRALRNTGLKKEAVLWADGKRNLWDIYQRERGEGLTVPLGQLIRYFQVLGDIGYLRLERRP